MGKSVIKSRKSLAPWIHDDIQYYDYQVDGIRELSKRKSFLLGDDMGLGKAQPLSEPVLTPSGWRKMGELRVGDYVTALDGTPSEIIKVHEVGERSVMKVTFSDGSWTRCDLDHLWAVTTPSRKNKGYDGIILSTRELLNRGLKHSNGNNKYYIPQCAPVDFLFEKNNLDAYMIGVLLGDGSLSQQTVSISTDHAIIENLNLPLDCEAVMFRDEENYNGSYRLNGLAKYLRKLNMMGKRSEEKFIPHSYKYGSIHDRIAILQGLLDTDGTTVSSRGQVSTTIEYGTTSKQLASDVDHIVKSLGGLTSIHEKHPTFTHKGEKKEGQLFYRMILRLPGWLTPYRLERKLENWIPRSKYEPTRAIVKIEHDGIEKSQCITIDSNQQIYLTRDFIATHNSLQSLTVFGIDVYRGWADKALIIAPSTLKANWQDEIEKFTTFKHIILDGSPSERNKQLLHFYDIQGPKILITNYEQIHDHQGFLDRMHFDVAIFDEAHYLKNPEAKRTEACLNVYSRRSFLLTGTPMLNHVNELWSIFHRIDPQRFPDYWRFVNRYVVYGGFKNKQIVGVKNEKELQALLDQYMIRRLKSEVLDLPEVQYIDKMVDLKPEQLKLYTEVATELKLQRWDKDDPDDIENALTKFLRLKQICGTTFQFTNEDISSKLDMAVSDALELLENEHRIIVFTQFRDVADCYADRIAGLEYPVYQLDGGVKKPDRQPMVKEWANTVKPGVIVCTIQVAGVGLNMTAARHIQFVDQLFVPGLNQQAVDRAYRIGADETQPVQVFIYKCRKTIEARVDEILRVKKSIFGKVVENDPEWKKKLVEAMLEDLNEAA